jgi:hypothetical protein
MKPFSRDVILLSYTILIGAAPLIPIPFVDEWIAAYLWRRMIADLAKKHGVKLTKREVFQLSDQKKSGLMGIIISYVVRPIKELFREIFFWLDWKRGIDLATRTYYHGYLMNFIFETGNYNPEHAAKYKPAIQHALKGANTKLLRGIILKTFTSSKEIIRTVRIWLFQFGKYYLKLTKNSTKQKIKYVFSKITKAKALYESERTEGDINDYFDEARPTLNDLIPPVLESLYSGIGSLPKEHFDILCSKLIQELSQTTSANINKK